MVKSLKPLELRDIHLPDAVSWWPPAIGWWVLLLALILMLVGIVFVLKKMRQVSVRKSSIVEFKSIQLAFLQHQDKSLLSQQLSQLLRQILLSSQPRSEVASVAGKQWLDLLNVSHPKGMFKLEWLELLSISSYQKEADYDADELLEHIERWINTYPKRYLL
jgi:hypothetical protein